MTRLFQTFVVVMSVLAVLVVGSHAICPSSVEDVVKEMIRLQLDMSPDQEIQKWNSLTDLGASQLQSMEIGLALEEKLGVDIPDEDWEWMQRSVNDIVHGVQRIAC